MNKKGFTLVELLVTVTILALIMIIAIPSIQGISKKIKTKMLETKISEAKESFLLWAQDNKNCIFKDDNTNCMIDKDNCTTSENVITCSATMGVLAANSLIDYDDENAKYIMNPVDNTDMSETEIKITYNTNTKMFNVLDAEIITNTTSTTTTTTSTTTTTTTTTKVTYTDFELTESNLEKIGYSSESENIIIPSTFFDETDQKWYKVTSINNAFFMNKNLKNITIPSTVKIIKGLTFYGASSLENVVFEGEGLETLEALAFASCHALSTITIPSTIKSIAKNTFDNCISLTSISINGTNSDYSTIDGVLFGAGGTELIQYPILKANTSYTIPSTVKIIKEKAFYDAEYLQEVILPSGVQTIESYVFTYAEKLKNITIPVSLTSVGESAFQYTILSNVYYRGSSSQWNSINIAGNNNRLTGASITYNYTG